MDASNQFTQATIVAGQTVRRLEREGLSVDEAKRLVAGMINEEESKVMKGERAFDEKGFIERLRRLPNTSA
ncbi:MAG TPA: hypothetical protein VKV04_15475 [Verrucomicrobiae bacterium]|nr:hypothetical protein [Verrucomicrobiae bacterium]